jgi:hypothetical protein
VPRVTVCSARRDKDAWQIIQEGIGNVLQGHKKAGQGKCGRRKEGCNKE